MKHDYHIPVRHKNTRITANAHGIQGFNMTPTRRDTIEALRQANTEFLDSLADTWNDPEAAARVGKAWGILEEEVTAWAALHATDQLITEDELWYRTALTAAMSVHVLETGAAITNEAILTAPDDDLEAWAETYEERTRTHHAELQKQEERAGAADIDRWKHVAWAKALAAFQEEAAKLWQTQRRLGLR
jgi:hypothetical protein